MGGGRGGEGGGGVGVGICAVWGWVSGGSRGGANGLREKRHDKQVFRKGGPRHLALSPAWQIGENFWTSSWNRLLNDKSSDVEKQNW